VVTSTIAFEGEGRWREFEGGVTDWLTQTKRASDIAQAKGQKGTTAFNYGRDQAAKPSAALAAAPVAPVAPATATKTRKLSFKEQRELDALPEKIAELEAEQSVINAQLADGTLYASNNPLALQLASRNSAIEVELLAALERWELLGA
jgi:ATP-binding cassette subfamily F protein uup